MPILLILSALLAGAGLTTVCDDAPKDVFTKELKARAGMWRPTSAENNGFQSPDGALEGTTWIRDIDGTWTMWRGDKPVVGWAVKEYRRDEDAKAIDIKVTTGAHKGVVCQGIYELDGETLRICLALPDRTTRPTEFSAGKGSVCALSEFKLERN